MIKINPNRTIALIDLSSYVFYRYFAIQKWIKISGTELANDELLAKFDALFEDNIKKISKKLKIDFSNMILARDCQRSNIWRNDIHPDYKGNRTQYQDSPMIFKHTYDTIIPRMQEKYKLQYLTVPRAEADDIIAVIHDHIRASLPAPNPDIYIMTADTDFLQIQHPNTHIADFQFKDLAAKLTPEKLEHYLLTKIIAGDKSDNIPPIDQKIGPATALKLAKDPALLEARLQKSHLIRDTFKRNQTLISFKHIRDDIRASILQNHTWLEEQHA